MLCAASASEGRAWLGAEAIELMIADCLMAGEQGEELAAQVASSGIPVILISGDAERVEALEARAVPALRKPFTLAQLKAIVERVLAP